MSEVGISSDAIFTEQWAIYRKVIDCDYMSHVEIAGRLATEVAGCSPLRVLDLGCGDMEVTSKVFDGIPEVSLTGVDSSGMALSKAEDMIAKTSIRGMFIESDLLAYLKNEGPSFDLILAGFSLHHLQAGEKQEFFNACSKRLAESGRLLLFDCVRPPGLPRSVTLQRYLDWIESEWTEMSLREKEQIRHHIMTSDFPEENTHLLEMGKTAGFQTQEFLEEWDSGVHSLLSFTR